MVNTPGHEHENFAVRSFASDVELARSAAKAWLDQIDAANRAGKLHCVALSGGRITRTFFSSTVEQAKARNVSFERVHFFWADERCVPPDDPESNYRLAREGLFVPLNISERQIHRLHGEDPPEAAARAAEAELREVVTPDPRGRPALDLVFLGLGEDGHVASLFPGEREEIAASDALYRAITNSPKPPPNRITLSYSAIAAAQSVWVLVSGQGKEQVLRNSLAPGGRTSLARILKQRRLTEVYTDIQAG
jgi:6-phosphogluconolactonase